MRNGIIVSISNPVSIAYLALQLDVINCHNTLSLLNVTAGLAEQVVKVLVQGFATPATRLNRHNVMTACRQIVVAHGMRVWVKMGA